MRQSAEPVKKLRREAGLIGLLYASLGGIIGSGRLFGPKNAAQIAGREMTKCRILAFESRFGAPSGCPAQSLLYRHQEYWCITVLFLGEVLWLNARWARC